jgi:LuxR family maltose regulon positive regulatory protein
MVVGEPPKRDGHRGGHRDVPIETKLHAPGLRREWVERPELVAELANSPARLILVDAPVGSGKTTAVAQWRASVPDRRRFAWISLDSGDNDPAALWSYVVHALGRAAPEFDGEATLRALRVRQPDVTGTVLPILVNELIRLSDPVILVLDDYDVISDAGCHDQLAFLLLSLPSSVQLVVVTRSLPPLPLARLRATGGMTEFGERQLRFRAADAAALLRTVAGVELTEPDLAALVQQTEGWAAGLYLAALSLRGSPAPSAFIHQFTGENRFIVDLLADEVLSQQPAEIREFLLRTAILGRFCAPLCAAVTGSARAAEIIDVLERENLFIVPLDDTRQWFRYHHLFAQVLRSELARTEPRLIATLHARASAWHRQAGSADEAISHALAAGDPAGAVDIIASCWYSHVDSGRMATVSRWIGSLGDDEIAASPVAAHCAAWLAALSGEPESLRRWLPVIEAGQAKEPLPDGMQSLESSAALLRATFGFGGLGDMRAAAAEAVRLESDPESPWRALALAAQAATLYFAGDLRAAAAQAQSALLSPSCFAIVRMASLTFLSLAELEDGQVSRAADLAHAARGIATDPALGLAGSPQSAIAHTATGAVYAALGRPLEARAELEDALLIRRGWSGISPWYTNEMLLQLAPVLLDLGDSAGALAHLDEVRRLLQSSPDGSEVQLERVRQLASRITGEQSQRAALAQPLTEREVAVLRLLRGTLSLRAIGQELDLSQNTIKTHTQAIYRKLGVATRSDAVHQGRAAGVI